MIYNYQYCDIFAGDLNSNDKEYFLEADTFAIT